LIGNIYLNVYADIQQVSKRFNDPGLAAMDFSAASTDMSLLFEDSPSIRSTFSSLLETYGGVGGLLNIEYDPRVFWWKGQALDISLRSLYLPPDEIEGVVNQHLANNNNN
jgi:hypothetical protein